MPSAKMASRTSSLAPVTIGISERPCSQSGCVDPEHVADRREEVDVRHERVGDLAAGEPARAAQDQHHADAAVGQRRLGAREGDAVVGGADDERVARKARVVERVEHRPDAAVERARAGGERGHVARASRPCRAGSPAAARSARRRPTGWKNSRWVSKKPTDRKNGSAGALRRMSIVTGATSSTRRRRDLDHPVVADDVGPLRDVLLADQRRVVADRAQRVDDVVGVVVQRPAAMREPEHAVGVGVLAGEQARAAGRARRGGAERLPEEDALLGQALDAGRRDGVAVRLHVAAGVVRVQVEDVRARHEARTVPRSLRRPGRPRARRPATRRPERPAHRAVRKRAELDHLVPTGVAGAFGWEPVGGRLGVEVRRQERRPRSRAARRRRRPR